jgi:hypothetical protein
MVHNSLRVNEEAGRAEQEAGAQLASIADMVACLEHAESCDNPACGADCPHNVEQARAAITDDALTVEVRTDWHSVGAVEAAKPTHYKILLCWGGPAVQIIGTLDTYNQPDSATLQYQDWFTEWTNYPLTDAEAARLVKYAQQYYYDE